MHLPHMKSPDPPFPILWQFEEIGPVSFLFYHMMISESTILDLMVFKQVICLNCNKFVIDLLWDKKHGKKVCKKGLID